MVLIVDDHPDNCLPLGKLLARIKIKAECVPSGRDALRFVKGIVPTVIIMDKMMPDMSGRETVRAMRVMPALREVAIFFYTGSGIDAREFEECKPAGVFRKGTTRMLDILNLVERTHREVLGGFGDPGEQLAKFGAVCASAALSFRLGRMAFDGGDDPVNSNWFGLVHVEPLRQNSSPLF